MGDKRTYFLNLPTLLTYLHGQSCELTAALTIAGKKATGLVLLKEGTIVGCQLTFQNGVQVTGEQAYEQIQHCTEWQVQMEQPKEWKIETSPFLPRISPSAAGSASGMGTSQHVPPLKPKGELNNVMLQKFSPRERLILRSVFFMVNGRRSVEDIKAQLRLPSGSVEGALMTLRLLDLIE